MGLGEHGGHGVHSNETPCLCASVVKPEPLSKPYWGYGEGPWKPSANRLGAKHPCHECFAPSRYPSDRYLLSAMISLAWQHQVETAAFLLLHCLVDVARETARLLLGESPLNDPAAESASDCPAYAATVHPAVDSVVLFVLRRWANPHLPSLRSPRFASTPLHLPAILFHLLPPAVLSHEYVKYIIDGK